MDERGQDKDIVGSGEVRFEEKRVDLFSFGDSEEIGAGLENGGEGEAVRREGVIG